MPVPIGYEHVLVEKFGDYLKIAKGGSIKAAHTVYGRISYKI